MSLKKFGHNDVILNTMKTHPSCEFFISEGRIFYNNHPSSSIYAFASGASDCVSLYELNINRSYDNTDRAIGETRNITGSGDSDSYTALTDEATNAGEPNSYVLDTGRAYAWQYKDSSKQTFKRISDTTYNTYIAGDVMTSSYPMSASITREFMSEPGAQKTCTDLWKERTDTGLVRTFKCTPEHPHFWALKNRLNFYGIRSEHYKVTSSHGNKMSQPINLISIPTIFYGSKIKPGTLSLKWYLTGTLIGELQDKKQNGELIQVTGSSLFQDKVAGVVLYDEGFILLTGSWNLNHETIGLVSGTIPRVPVKPKWIYFGAGAKDDVTPTTTGSGSFASASFDLSFKGTTETQVMTMFTHAKRGEVNYSNNPTFLSYGQDKLRLTSSQVYEENSTQRILNTVSSSYSDYSASFKRQVYVSRIGIYDDSRNLIGVATLSNPVLKKEDEDFSFKIRLDI
jgi:hypothetical protein